MDTRDTSWNRYSGVMNSTELPPNSTVIPETWTDHPIHWALQRVCYEYIIPVVCVLGWVGNIINLLVLSQRRCRTSSKWKETASLTGIALLAISDWLYCLVLFPRAFSGTLQAFFTHKDFSLYYQMYGSALVNMFRFTSTWITVMLAVTRYLGICHPFKSSVLGTARRHAIAYAVVIISCIAFNSVWFRKYDIIRLPANATGGYYKYMLDIGIIDRSHSSGMAFFWINAVLGIFIPAVILVFCNVSLISTLRQSHRVRQMYNVKDPASRARNRITTTLVTVAIMFIVLVFPSEIMAFCVNIVRGDVLRTELFLTLQSLGEVLQSIAFAANFLLYCAVNGHFRATFRDMMGIQHFLYRLNSARRSSNGTTRTRLSSN